MLQLANTSYTRHRSIQASAHPGVLHALTSWTMTSDRAASGNRTGPAAKMSQGCDLRQVRALLPRTDLETINAPGSGVRSGSAAPSSFPLPCRFWETSSPSASRRTAARARQVSRSGLQDAAREYMYCRRRRKRVEASPRSRRKAKSSAATRSSAPGRRDQATARSGDGLRGVSTFQLVCRLHPEVVTSGGGGAAGGRHAADGPARTAELLKVRDEGQRDKTESARLARGDHASRNLKPHCARRLFESSEPKDIFHVCNADPSCVRVTSPGMEHQATAFMSTSRHAHPNPSGALSSSVVTTSLPGTPEGLSSLIRTQVQNQPGIPSDSEDMTFYESPAKSGEFSPSSKGEPDKDAPFTPTSPRSGKEVDTSSAFFTRRQALNETTPQEHAATFGLVTGSRGRDGRLFERHEWKCDHAGRDLQKRHGDPLSPALRTLSIPLGNLRPGQSLDPRQSLFDQEQSNASQHVSPRMTFGLRPLQKHGRYSTESRGATDSNRQVTTGPARPETRAGKVASRQSASPDLRWGHRCRKASDDEMEAFMPPAKRVCHCQTSLQPPPAPRKPRPLSRMILCIGDNVIDNSLGKVHGGTRSTLVKTAKRRLNFGQVRTRTESSTCVFPESGECRTRNRSGRPSLAASPPLTMGSACKDNALKHLLPSVAISLPLSPEKAAAVSPAQALALNLLSHSAGRQAVRRLKRRLSEAFHRGLAQVLAPLNSGSCSKLYRMPLSQAIGHLCSVMLQEVAARVLEEDNVDTKREVAASFLKDVRASLHQNSWRHVEEAALQVASFVSQALNEVDTLHAPDGEERLPGDASLARRSSLLLSLYVPGEASNPASRAEVTRLSITKMHALWREAVRPPADDVWENFLERLQRKDSQDQRSPTRFSSSNSTESQSDHGTRPYKSCFAGGLRGSPTDDHVLPPLPAFLAGHQCRPLAEAWRDMTGLDWQPRGQQCWEGVYLEKVRDRCLQPWRETAREVVLFLSLTT